MHNDLHLELFSFSHVRLILGRSLNTCMRLERVGALPRPMFVSKKSAKQKMPTRYYTGHQIFELQKLKYEFGLPGEFLLKKAGTYPFWIKLRERWDYLYSCYEKGTPPDSPILLEFANIIELRNYLMGNMRKMGVQSTALLNELQDGLLQFRKAT